MGEANWTIEQMFEEASPGCPRRCKLPPLTANESGEDAEDGDGISDEEAEFVTRQIEEMADRFHAGEKLRSSDFEHWEWELFVYWRKTERDFERQIQVKLGFLVDSVFNQ